MNEQKVRDAAYWKELLPQLNLTVDGAERIAAPVPLALDSADNRWRQHLVEEGYLHLDGTVPRDTATSLSSGISAIRQQALPPVFAFVYDEYWNFYHGLAGLLRPILGNDLCMLPDFWAWHVDPERKEAGWGTHRDKLFNSLFADGMPKSVTVWVPLTDADPLNGCMYLIPANQDRNYLNFSPNPLPVDLQGVRALCARAGSLLLWNQRVMHWGGRSSDRASGPRISMAFEFQRGDIEPYNQPLLRMSSLPSFETRLRLIGKQILQYTHMYQYSEELVSIAKAMVAATGRAPQDMPAEPAAVSRNHPCPCGSGKKYKHCHGKD